MLIISAASELQSIMTGAVASYKETLKYLECQEAGNLLAYGCYSREDMEKTSYPQKAYEMGKAIR